MSVVAYQRLFDTGMQYYTIGRYSVLAGVNPVAGNLLHHAIEMFLRGALAVSAAASPSAEDEPREPKSLSHRLDQLWPEFKATFRSKKLANYDRVIAELKTFENIRQPAKRISQGLTGKISVKRSAQSAEASWGMPAPIYELSLQEIDELAAIIFAAAHVNPKYFVSGLKAARHYLAEGNAMTV